MAERGKTSGEGSVGNHLLDGLDASERTFGERKAQSDGADEFAVHVNGTPAHSLYYTRLGEWAPTELGQDDALPGSDIFEYTEDFDLELFDSVTLEDSATNAMHSWADIFQREEVFSLEDGSHTAERSNRDYQRAETFQPRTSGGLTRVSHFANELFQALQSD